MLCHNKLQSTTGEWLHYLNAIAIFTDDERLDFGNLPGLQGGGQCRLKELFYSVYSRASTHYYLWIFPANRFSDADLPRIDVIGGCLIESRMLVVPNPGGGAPSVIADPAGPKPALQPMTWQHIHYFFRRLRDEYGGVLLLDWMF